MQALLCIYNMLIKGIIETIEDRYHYRVRIPDLHKIKSDSNATATALLPVACVCTPPGINPMYKIGEVVFVDYINDLYSEPVILGSLYRDAIDSSSDIVCDSLLVEVNSELPENTKLGTLNAANIKNINQAVDNIIQNYHPGGDESYLLERYF